VSRAAPHLTADWPLRCEISRLEARVGHLTERVAQDVARLSSLRASRAKAHATTLELQRVIRAAAGAEPTDRVVALSHSGRLLARIMAELTALRERVGPAEAELAEARRALAEAERTATAAQRRAEASARHAAAAEAEVEMAERRRADATAGANTTAATLEALRKSIRAERRSIAGREGAVERRVQAAHREAEDRVAQAAAAQAEAREEARQQAVWTQAQLEALRAEVARAEAEGPRASELRRVKREAAKEVARLSRRRRRLRRRLQARSCAGMEKHVRAMQAALQSANRKIEELTLVPPLVQRAPRQPLLDHMLAGPRSVTVHRARLAQWVLGDGPDVEAARLLASGDAG
jgi:chromosome segregation ATPase